MVSLDKKINPKRLIRLFLIYIYIYYIKGLWNKRKGTKDRMLTTFSF